VVIPAWVRRRLKLSAGDELQVELGPEPDRTIILRCARTLAEVERLLAKGHGWFEETGRDLVEELHASRRRARVSERRRRS